MSKCCSENIVAFPSEGKKGTQGVTGDQGPVGDTGDAGADGANGFQELAQQEKIIIEISVPTSYNGLPVSASNLYPATILTSSQLAPASNGGLIKDLSVAPITPLPVDFKYMVWCTYGKLSQVPCRDASILGFVERVYVEIFGTGDLIMEFNYSANYRIVILG